MNEMRNSSYRINLAFADGKLHTSLTDIDAEKVWSDAPYFYSLLIDHPDGILDCRILQDASMTREDGRIIVEARLGGIKLCHCWKLPGDRTYMDESITLTNDSDTKVSILGLEFGLLHRIADTVGKLDPKLVNERVIAVPFRKRPSDDKDWYNDHILSDLLKYPGREGRCDDKQKFGFLPSRHWCSEAWAWKTDGFIFNIMKFNQERMEYSTLSTVTEPEGLSIRFGGAYLKSQDGLPVVELSPGESFSPGLMRYRTVKGTYSDAAYTYRQMLDEHGCRFPEGFNPPVHWNELYDNPEWWVLSPAEMPEGSRISTRKRLYTRKAMEEEAKKASEYSCEALYMDPGWDTTFASFQWDEKRLGRLDEFVGFMKDEYGLAVSLHMPLSSWMSRHSERMNWKTAEYWPKEAQRMLLPGRMTDDNDYVWMCLGSKQYIDEAEKRMLALCEAGIAYIMFDGNWWNGPCWHHGHGHPVPYRYEDHVNANVELAKRVHQKFPDVLIEMHDMLCGGAIPRATPVYYKYGITGSYDSNWGFELMWQPKNMLSNGRALSLYYYNLACNVPVYLHIDLRDDNEFCTFFWWFASTCRHLGIGGTHAEPNIVFAQKHAMKNYRRLEAFYKRGEFYGISEQIHVHTLPGEDRIVVDIFNLSDQEQFVEGGIEISRLGISTDCFYKRSERFVRFDQSNCMMTVECNLPAWGHKMVEVERVR